jgi:hypothetical protein
MSFEECVRLIRRAKSDTGKKMMAEIKAQERSMIQVTSVTKKGQYRGVRHAIGTGPVSPDCGTR